MQINAIFICTTSRPFTPIRSYTGTNQAATNGLDLDGLDGLPSVPVVLRKYFVGDESNMCYYGLKAECLHSRHDGWRGFQDTSVGENPEGGVQVELNWCYYFWTTRRSRERDSHCHAGLLQARPSLRIQTHSPEQHSRLALTQLTQSQYLSLRYSTSALR